MADGRIVSSAPLPCLRFCGDSRRNGGISWSPARNRHPTATRTIPLSIQKIPCSCCQKLSSLELIHTALTVKASSIPYLLAGIVPESRPATALLPLCGRAALVPLTTHTSVLSKMMGRQAIVPPIVPIIWEFVLPSASVKKGDKTCTRLRKTVKCLQFATV